MKTTNVSARTSGNEVAAGMVRADAALHSRGRAAAANSPGFERAHAVRTISLPAAPTRSVDGARRAPAAETSFHVVRPLRFFRRHLHRLLALAIAESAIIAAAFYVAIAIRFQSWLTADLEALVGPLWPRLAIAVTVITLCLGAMGLYQLHQRLAITAVTARVLVALVMAEAVFACVFYAVPSLFVGRGVMAIMAVLAAIGLIAIRTAFGQLVDRDVFKRTVLVWGCGGEAAAIGKRMRRRCDQRGFRIVGYVRCPGERPCVPQSVGLQDRAALFDYIDRHHVEEIVVAMDDRRRGFPTELLRACRMRGVVVRDLVAFLEEESGQLNVDLARPSSLIFCSGFRTDIVREAGKRAFDVAAALAVLAVSLPIAVLAAIAIRLEDGGPVFYRQERTGQHGRPFGMFKFRSMRVDAESRGAVWARRNDARVTRVGALIRRLRVDEIPQVINVLRGDMSFVGPRPERPTFVAALAESIPFYTERHFVKPGITGWAQIRYPYGASESDAREKLGYDLYYVKNHSLLFDLVILLRTVEIVLFRVGSR